MTLAEFLLARIAEDEDWPPEDELGHDAFYRCPLAYGHQGECTCGAVAARRRALAECEAKRRIVEAYLEAEALMRATPGQSVEAAIMIGGAKAFEVVCKVLAQVYAEHPDYDQAWVIASR